MASCLFFHFAPNCAFLTIRRLHDIRRMHLQAFINKRADTEQHHRDNPEIHRGIKSSQEPLFLINGAAVAFHNIDNAD